jgi:hypothetical protein
MTRRPPSRATAFGNLLLLAGLCGVLAGCSFAGNDGGSSVPASVSVPAKWSRQVGVWVHDLRVGGRHDRGLEYPTPSLATLRQRLAMAERRYGFRVVLIRLVPAPQASPLVIVQARSATVRFSRRVADIMRLLVPQRGSQSRQYEGFFFGAEDGRGRPFLDGFSVLPLREGGQWSRSAKLYPFEVRG